MKISFNSIVPTNAPIHSFSFTNLKSYLIAKKCEDEIVSQLFLCEDAEEKIVDKILSVQPKIITFSAYIWNMEIIEKIATRIKRNTNDVFIIVGGPEVMYTANDVLAKNSSIDILAMGEGELILPLILESIRRGKADLDDIAGICYRKNGQIIQNQPAGQLKLEEQNYPIYIEDFREMKGFLYETSRGCPYRCNFCTWQYSRGIRYYPMQKVIIDLKKIFTLPYLEIISFADSNLLLNKKRCLKIFKLINKCNEQRIANKKLPVFPHFELNPEFFDDELIEEFVKFPIDFTKKYIPKLGLQSTDRETLKISNRKWNVKKYTENYRKIINKGFKAFSFEIIHGLPGDSLEKYKKSLDFLISDLNAERFVSYYYLVTPGSYFREHAEEFGLVWEKKPPYRLIRSNTFSEEDLDKADFLNYYLQLIFNALPRIKKTIDIKFNTGKLKVYEKIIDYISKNYGKDFSHKKLLGDWNLSTDLARMISPDYYHIRRKIILESLNIIKTYSETNA